MRRVHGLRHRADHAAGFEHDRHGVGDIVRLAGVDRAGFLEGRRVRAVAGHAVVQRAAAGHEAFGLGVVDAVDQAHEFAGDVAMEPRRPERIASRQPARWENHEIDVAGSRGLAGGLQHQEDRLGKGYPQGIKTNSLVLDILGVLDRFDAMISERPFRFKRFQTREALDFLKKDADEGRFEPEVLRALVALLRKEKVADLKKIKLGTAGRPER